MKKMILPVSLVCFLVGSIFLFSCNNDAKSGTAATTFNLDSAHAAIIANNKVYGECFATGDSVKFVSCYTADACINPPNMPRMCGTKERATRDLSISGPVVIGPSSRSAK